MTRGKPPGEHVRVSDRGASHPRPYMVGVRLNVEERQLLDAAMTRTGKSGPELLREAFLNGPDEATIRASERERMAFRLRSVYVADFLNRHGLHPRTSARTILAAVADEIGGAGVPKLNEETT